MKCSVRNILSLYLLIISCQAFAQQVDIYDKQKECEDSKTKLCLCIKNLIKSLDILEKIQKNNFMLLQKSPKNKDESDGSIKDYKDITKNDIVIIRQDEYESLKRYMKAFCGNFKQLNKQEQITLFLLVWNKNLLFRNTKDVNVFCKQQYKL